jgi:hypothetical protein
MPTADPTFTVRTMRLDEVDLIRTWANDEGWNPGLHDGPCFFATDPAGFFVGEVGGQPVACISCVGYDDTFGFLGQYIVKPEFRGLGYGVRIWEAGMAHLGTRNVGLDGVLAQRENYERSGFVFAHHHIRYGGTGGGRRPDGIIDLAEVPFEDVLAYDRSCFPAPRAAFLRGWLTLPESVALGSVREGRLAGFGAVRRSADGYKIGPLFADDHAAAMSVLEGLMAEIGNTPFCLDAPEESENPAASELIRHFGGKELFRTARMYTRGRPPVDRARIFGITTMELG